MRKKIEKILIANRGEIACRIIDTAKKLNIKTLALYSDADATARHTKMADEAFYIGKSPVNESYLKAQDILEIAKNAKADAIHPGYGFLSENAEFAENCAKNGIIFIGPTGASIRAMGLKGAAKALMIKAGVPVVPGYHGADQKPATLKAEAGKIGYPLLIKAVAGGGGKGMRLVEGEKDFIAALESAKREAISAFGNGDVLIEKYITTPRHIEIQVFGDTHGGAVYLFERDCSLQRRHQKVVEEAPAPHMPEAVRKAMGDAAVRAVKAIGYHGAGTIEFIVDAAGKLTEKSFYFMEMNTRLQVEHPVSEAITGEDLVAWQILVAEGQPLPKTQEQLKINGHAFEVRLYAEDPLSGFLPQTGRLNYFHVPSNPHIRLETGIVAGDEVSPFYDPMIAKIISHGKTRAEALEFMSKALDETAVQGLKTNLAFLNRTIKHPSFMAGDVETGFIEKHKNELIPPKPDKAQLTTPALMALAVHIQARKSSQPQDFDATSHPTSHPTSPWSDTSGWRMGLKYNELIKLNHDGGERFSIRYIKGEIDSFELDGKSYSLSKSTLEKKCITITINGQKHVAQTWHDEKQVAIMMAGECYNFTLASALANDDQLSSSAGAIASPMPGKIIKICVANGDSVKTGEPLVILEAMKMEYTLKATKDGVVDGLNIKENQQVADGAILLNIVEKE